MDIKREEMEDPNPTHIHDVEKSSLGFMELLGIQDFNATYNNPSSFDDMMMYLAPSSSSSLSIAPLNHDDDDGDDDDHRVCMNHDVDDDGESSEVLNGPPLSSSPNSSSTINGDQQVQNPTNMLKRKKERKVMKKMERGKRIAFMTKSEVDHLEDGYRWRKYGQKPLKNSPYPRSYYRCTNATCTVKKRVERSLVDPTIIVTTYEGQHIHPSPSIMPQGVPSTAFFNHQITRDYLHNDIINPTTNYIFNNKFHTTPSTMVKLDQGGLLQDIVPSVLRKND